MSPSEPGKPALLYLEDHTVFHGRSVGLSGTSGGEICFNTGMTGYQEIFTDPSYFGQIMVTASTHIGNYGTKGSEDESAQLQIAGLVCRQFSQIHSRPSASEGLLERFAREGKVAIDGIDTRAVVRHIRDKGAMNALITTEISDPEALKDRIASVPSMEGLELSSRVSTSTTYEIGSADAPLRVAALDYGVKKAILDNLAERGCRIKVFPMHTPLEELLSFDPHGIFLSNGPGDPAAMTQNIHQVRAIVDSGLPVFGICLGHQLLSLSQGLQTEKMHNGHRGINHPVLNLESGLGEITSQNHGFVVTASSLEGRDDIVLTHKHLNDHSVAGIRIKERPVFSVQFHPEASPGPHDSRYLFDAFCGYMKNENKK